MTPIKLTSLAALFFSVTACVDGLVSSPLSSKIPPGMEGGGGEEDGGIGTFPATGFAVNAPSTIVRRLSRRELGNVVESLIGVRPASLAQVPGDKSDFTFDRVAEAQTISQLHLDAFETLANDIADELLDGQLDEVVSACSTHDRACVGAFIDDVVVRAYRRPLVGDEKNELLELYDAAESFDEGFRLVANAVFRGVNFLYVVEQGQPVPGRTDVIEVDSYSVAARLSLALCETLPDAELRAAAAADELNDPNEIVAQARRLFDGGCARETIDYFYSQWLRVNEIGSIVRDADLFPEFTPTLRTAMQRESERFIDYVMWEHNGTLRDLFTAPFSILDEDIAPLYGIEGLGADPERIELPADRRGILTQPGLLALNADPNETSPVKRGVFILRRILCGNLPPPPQDIAISRPPPDPDATTRERWAAHSANPVCSSCHTAIDPVGFAMENFDPLGRVRDTENGLPVDARGGVPSLGIPKDSIEGGAELAEAIAGTEHLSRCFARNWARFVLARLEAPLDEEAIARERVPLDADAPLKDTLLSFFASDAFRYRPIVEE